MKKDPRVYLLHIRDALDCIERYTEQGENHFLADEMTQDAVIYNLAIIGEAVKKLPKAICTMQPSIPVEKSLPPLAMLNPWKDIAGMRDIVIHDYDSTEIQKIWNVVKRDLPVLKLAITVMLTQMDQPRLSQIAT